MPRRTERQDMLWTESGELRTGPVVEVALPIPFDRTYSFSVPDGLAERVVPGTRVVVPLGRRDRPQVGYVVAADTSAWTSTLKSVLEVLDPAPLLSEPLLELGRWISWYSLCPLGKTLAAMLPEAVRSRSGFRRVRFVELAGPAEELLRARPPLTRKRRAVVDCLAKAQSAVEMSQLAQQSGVSNATIAKMVERGLLSVEHRRVPAPAPDFDLPRVTPDFQLNSAQLQSARLVEQWIDPPVFRVGVLLGVSGSGKTEVYIRAIQRCLDAGRQAIVLVPEIALTSQTAPRLAQRFSHVAVLHSGLTPREKSLTWNEIASGAKKVIIGTRSAVFAPCPKLGLIVIDEEQEASFKNQQAPRFHARDVAIKRAQLESIPIVLGSATPSLETWANVSRLPHYELLRLPHRVSGLALPVIHLVDMRVEARERKGVHFVSRLMEQKLAQALDRGEQAVLLLNRRGFATCLFCSVCRQRVLCPRCGVNMVYHRAGQRALCHYCGASIAIPRSCPDLTCRGKVIRLGMGTQRIEEELSAKFPNARIRRADSDTMLRTKDYRAFVEDFSARRFDILLGTQMIAKGLDFPFVSFVGVISADTALAIPDFRSGERTFQLVTQVAGRAGRSLHSAGQQPGQVVVQSFAPDVAAIQSAVGQDFERFAEQELKSRQQLGLPPFARLIRIVLCDARESRLSAESEALAERLRDALSAPDLGVRIAGPNPCPISRMRDLYRRQILIALAHIGRRAEITRILRAGKLLTARVKRIIVDPDPVSLL